MKTDLISQLSSIKVIEMRSFINDDVRAMVWYEKDRELWIGPQLYWWIKWDILPVKDVLSKASYLMRFQSKIPMNSWDGLEVDRPIGNPFEEFSFKVKMNFTDNDLLQLRQIAT